jgi:hypothetical protein
MNISYLTRVRAHFNCAEKHINRHNMRQWVRSVRFLGDKWLLAVPVVRK